ncbi:MAG TPA: ATP-binding protein [Aestuariivirgaceae bacterium]|nr:ATP-binding protein [Aestuariivirgaceae bacterium]
MTAPSLAEYMSSDRPAWLWDAERARIVWANAAGVAWFGGETLFDLIDQPFDAKDEAIVRIQTLAQELPDGATARETLRLPCEAGGVATPCCLSLHALADGRAGVLVAVEDGGGGALPGGLAEDMLMALPLGAVLAGPDGDIRFANTAARDLVDSDRDADRLETFAGLIEDAESAKRLLSRAVSMRLASAIVPIRARYGRRELRVTAKLMAPTSGSAAPILILLDDVTDRRTLERALSGGRSETESTPPAPSAATAASQRLSDSDRRTFEALAAAILKGPETAAGGKAAEPVETPEPESPPEAAAPDLADAPEADSASVEPDTAPAVRVPEVPGLVSRALDALPHAVVLHRKAELLFANQAAVRALGFAGRDDLLARGDIGKVLAQTQSGEVVLPCEAGDRRFRLTRSSFPWNTGPVSQSALVPIDPAETARGEPEEPAEFPAVQQPRHEPEVRSDAAEPASATLAWEPVDAELRAILDTATDGIITLDENGHIRGFSAGAEALFGYRLADVAGRPFADLLAPESRKIVRNYLAALDHSGIASVFNDGREVEAVVAQGTVPLFIAIGRIGASGSKSGSGRGGGGQAYCVVVRDLTQWKKTEADLRRSKEEAERASAQKSEFLANISHELRTPLNAILGFSEVMRSQRFGTLANQKYLGYANDIHESGEHLLSLINDLLDLSKVEAGKLELNFTSVNVASLVEQCLGVLQEHAAAAQVVLRKTLPAGLPNVVADQRSVKQILLNLVSNAIKFTDPGGQVIVSARVSKAGELKVSVKDTGIGMSEAELAAAVQPFKRIENPGREQVPGTGLGLPLSRALAEANRASFAISSEPRKGTLVEITFPTTRVLAG